MLDGVRQAFLNEAVRGQVDPRRKLRRIAFDLELDGQARLPRLRDEAVQVLEAGLWGKGRRFLGAPQDADEPAHLGERLAAGLLDDLERLTFLFLIGLEAAADGACLDGHHAHAVADDVVQLARDPRALLGNRGDGLGFPLALELIGALICGRGLLELAPECKCCGPDNGEEQHEAEVVTPALDRIVERDNRGRYECNPETCDRLPPIFEDAEEDDRGQHGEERRCGEGDQTTVDERHDGPDHEQRSGCAEAEAAPPEERRGQDHDERNRDPQRNRWRPVRVPADDHLDPGRRSADRDQARKPVTAEQRPVRLDHGADGTRLDFSAHRPRRGSAISSSRMTRNRACGR